MTTTININTKMNSLIPIVKFTTKGCDQLSQVYQDGKKELLHSVGTRSLFSLGSTTVIGKVLGSAVGAETGSIVVGAAFGTPLLGSTLGAVVGSTVAVQLGTTAHTFFVGSRDYSTGSASTHHTQNHTHTPVNHNNNVPVLSLSRPTLVRAITKGVGAETGSRIGNRLFCLVGGSAAASASTACASSPHGYRIGAVVGSRLGTHVGAALGGYELGSMLGSNIRILLTTATAAASLL